MVSCSLCVCVSVDEIIHSPALTTIHVRNNYVHDIVYMSSHCTISTMTHKNVNNYVSQGRCNNSATIFICTFYIGIVMVVLAYFNRMRKLKFEFSLSVSTQFDFYQHQGGKHVEN